MHAHVCAGASTLAFVSVCSCVWKPGDNLGTNFNNAIHLL